jgi:hypothetical protein
MSYQVLVEFGEGSRPSSDDVQKLLRGFYPNFVSSAGNLFISTDPRTGDTLSAELAQPNLIQLYVPYTATLRSLAAAYSLAWTLADKHGGRVRDAQLGGIASFDLARQEWLRRETTGDLAKIFQGALPSDLKTEIRQRRGMLQQEVKIRGAELGIRRLRLGRSVNYTLPILSLGPVKDTKVANPRAMLPFFLGLLLLIIGGVVGTVLVKGVLIFSSLGVFVLTIVWLSRRKRHILRFPGQGGNLLLESDSPSKKEVEEFLNAIDRVRFALTRFLATGPE